MPTSSLFDIWNWKAPSLAGLLGGGALDIDIVDSPPDSTDSTDSTEIWDWYWVSVQCFELESSCGGAVGSVWTLAAEEEEEEEEKERDGELKLELELELDWRVCTGTACLSLEAEADAEDSTVSSRRCDDSLQKQHNSQALL